MKIKTVTIAGPTASGKTALSVALAKKIHGEIISCDSMQIYRGMDIGTAKPDKNEMCGIPHYLIDVADPRDEFSCADFKAMAESAAKKIFEAGSVPVICGGTGLYLDAVMGISSFSAAPSDEKIRERLKKEYELTGNIEIHRRLESIDPESAVKIHPNNVRRVIRALEIYEITGITKSEWDRKSKDGESLFDNTLIVLDFLNRELLYRRIDMRVDLMISAGLEAEVRRLYETGFFDWDTTSSQAIGYKEFLPYIRGECGLDEVIDRIKQYSRNYAKRQITWFSKYNDAVRVHPDLPDGTLKSTSDILSEVLCELEERGFGGTAVINL